MTSNQDHVPVALLAGAFWVDWRYEKRDGELTKPPIDPHNGRHASSVDPSTWSDHETAVAAATKRDLAGVGYVFSADNPHAGVDIDDCRDAETGKIAPWAQEIIDFLDTYAEVSPSGTGVKCWLAGELSGAGHRRQVEGGEVEIYDRERYFTFTGEHLPGTPFEVEARQDELTALVTRLEAARTAGKPAKSSTTSCGSGAELGIEDVLEKLRRGKKTGPLMRGDLSAYEDDESRADFALCLGAAGYVGPDPERIDAVYRLTPLMREKWDERRGDGTYGTTTIARVLEALEAEPAGDTQKDAIVAQAAGMPLYHTPECEGFAVVSLEDHDQLLPIMGKAYARHLRHRFWLAEHKTPSKTAVSDALAMLDARANYEGEERAIGVRVVASGGAVYLDLADRLWRAVRITADGWEVVQNPFLFRRGAATKALPLPVTGGSLEEMRPFINVADDDAFVLCCAWLVGSLRPRGPYPILGLPGEHGSAKTMAANLLRLLIDPAVPALKSLPTSERDLMIAARGNWIMAYDNLSGITPAMSDGLCRLSTGGGLSTRELYSDAGEMVFDATRPISLNGIDDIAARADLLSRSLVITLPPLKPAQRRQEKEMLAAFERLRPGLLGALCTAVSASLANVSKVHLKEAPRMADFAADVVAAESALPWKPGRFLEAYEENERMMRELALDMDRVAAAILDMLRDAGRWEGTATDLLKELRDPMSADLRGRDVPDTPRGAANRLRRLAPLLRERGVEVEFRKGTERLIVITSAAGPQDHVIIGGARVRIRPDRHAEK